MKDRLLAGVALAALIAGPAMAADMRAPVYRRPVVAAYNWTGCYVGGNVGWIGSRDTFNLSPAGNYLSSAGPLAPPNPTGTGAVAGDLLLVAHSYSADTQSGFEGGPQAGCNYQIGSMVFGAEADIQWTSIDKTVNAAYGPVASVSPGFTIAPHAEQVNSRLNWFSTARARFGFAFDRLLTYVTGGWVVEESRSDTSVAFGTFPVLPVYNLASHFGSSSGTRNGGVIGFGAEYAIGLNWSIKAEYLYFNLENSRSYFSPLVGPAGVAPGYAWYTSVGNRNQVARVGLNYHFGYVPPVITK